MSKKGGHPKSKGPAKPAASSKPEISPLEEFLSGLFEQSEARLVKAEQRSSKEVVKKVVDALVPVAKGMLTEPRSEGLQKHAIKCVMALNSSTSLGSALSKKVVSIFFTVLVDELHGHYKEYGFTDADIHPDYHIEFELHHKKDGVTYYWDAPDINATDFEAWERAWSLLKYAHERLNRRSVKIYSTNHFCDIPIEPSF